MNNDVKFKNLQNKVYLFHLPAPLLIELYHAKHCGHDEEHEYGV